MLGGDKTFPSIGIGQNRRHVIRLPFSLFFFLSIPLVHSQETRCNHIHRLSTSSLHPDHINIHAPHNILCMSNPGLANCVGRNCHRHAVVAIPLSAISYLIGANDPSLPRRLALGTLQPASNSSHDRPCPSICDYSTKSTLLVLTALVT